MLYVLLAERRKKADFFRGVEATMKKKKTGSPKAFVKKLLLCFGVIYIAGLLITQQFDISRLNREIDDVAAAISEEERNAKELQSELKRSETDEYAERVAREKLGYMKPHEKVFIDSSK